VIYRRLPNWHGVVPLGVDSALAREQIAAGICNCQVLGIKPLHHSSGMARDGQAHLSRSDVSKKRAKSLPNE